MMKKILLGTIFGGITFILAGWLVYGLLLADYLTENMNQCAALPMNELTWWALIVAYFSFALLLTLILKWSGAKTFSNGLQTGALVGFLMAVGIDLSSFSMTTMFKNPGALITDICVYALMYAVTGMVIVMLWGKEKPAS